MFISNLAEARAARCLGSGAEVITQQEILFCNRVNQLIQDNTPIEQWINLLYAQADLSIDVVKFNYGGLRYFV